MNLGLVHDYLLVMRGAERTFLAMAEQWPDARIYTTLYDAAGTEQRFADRDVQTSALQRLGIRQRGFRYLLPLFPRAAERLPVGAHDVVVSSSSAFAHGVRPGSSAVHICYCHSPFRYVWHERATALAEAPRALRPLLERQLDRIRAWDVRAAGRVTRYVANSALTAGRIADFYGREAAIAHPPVAVERFTADPAPEDWFLVVCELVRHKRVDVALRAAARAGRPVKVVGSGPELERWRAEFPGAEFLGRVDDDTLDRLYARALTLVVPNVEEFGIAAVEAQAAGRPVLAVAEGGALETIVDGETGVLVGRDEDVLAEAMREVDFAGFDPVAARRNAARFASAEFRRRLADEVDRALGGK